MKGAAAIVGAAFCAITTGALALPPPPYVVADMGYTHMGQKSSGFEELGPQSGGGRNVTGFAVMAGWRFTEHLAAEGGFMDLGEGKFSIVIPEGSSVLNAHVGVESRGMVLSLAGTWPINEKLSVEGRGGAYFGKTKARLRGEEMTTFGTRKINQRLASDSRTGLLVGLGAVYAVNETWAVRAGFDYLDKAFGKDAGRLSVGVRYNWP